MERTPAAGAILFAFRLIPLFLRRRLFRGLFLLFYHLSAKHRLITLYNLRSAFPEKPLKEIEGIAKGAFLHIGTVLAEFFVVPDLNDGNIQEWVEFEGLEHYVEARSRCKGVIASISHFGNWELMAAAFPFVARYGADVLNKAGVPVPVQTAYVIYRPLDNPVLENLTTWVRTLNGAILIPKGGTGKQSLALLQENEMVGIASDQNVAAREGVFVNFFGRPACTAVGLAVVALKTGSPVLPAFMPRVAEGKYKLVIEPIIEMVNTGNYEADLAASMERINQAIEAFIRRYPEQYFWMHQRWKTKPWQKG